MSKHNELRDKINELCPELMKLEMGCEIEYRNKEYIFIGHNDPLLPNWFEAKYKYAERLAEIYDTEDLKILGKDPTLEDVMRAIEMTDSSFNVIYERGGRINLTVKVIEENDNYTFYWQLGKPLSQQSDETVEKILEVLK